MYKTSLPFLDAEDTDKLLASMQTVSLEGGKSLFSVGEPADGVYFLVTGRVAVQKFTGFGDRTQVVGLLDPGAPVGEAGVLGEQRRDATVMAVVDTELLLLTRQEFEVLAEREPVLTIKLLKWLLSRASLRLKKSSERLAHVL